MSVGSREGLYGHHDTGLIVGKMAFRMAVEGYLCQAEPE